MLNINRKGHTASSFAILLIILCACGVGLQSAWGNFKAEQVACYVLSLTE